MTLTDKDGDEGQNDGIVEASPGLSEVQGSAIGDASGAAEGSTALESSSALPMHARANVTRSTQTEGAEPDVITGFAGARRVIGMHLATNSVPPNTNQASAAAPAWLRGDAVFTGVNQKQVAKALARSPARPPFARHANARALESVDDEPVILAEETIEEGREVLRLT